MSQKKRSQHSGAPATDPCLSFGWMLIGVFLLMGMALEAMHLLKSPFYVEVRLRRELWTLAHAHGALFGVLNVLFAVSAPSWLPDPESRRMPSRLLRAAGVLVPAGFLFGGIGLSESDPSLAIVAVPIGALLALAAIALSLQSSGGEG